jgi:hypothetical protein
MIMKVCERRGWSRDLGAWGSSAGFEALNSSVGLFDIFPFVGIGFFELF